MYEKKYTVMTMLFGENYDTLKNPEYVDSNATYICITDNINLKSDIWNIIYDDCGIEDKEYHGASAQVRRVYQARWNWHNYCNTDICVIMDASMKLRCPLSTLLSHVENYDGLIMPHPCRDNIYDEYLTWIDYRGMDKTYMDNFIAYSNTFGYNMYTKGLFCTGFMIFKKSFTTISLSYDILYLMQHISDNGDRNDQAYLSYLMNTKYFNCLDIMFISIETMSKKIFKFYTHNSDIEITEFAENPNIWWNNKKIHISDNDFF